MDGEIKRKTKIGMIWNAIERFSVQIVSFVIGIILARLLTPDDYGTVGLLTVFITFSNVFIDSGFSRGLIQKINRTEEDFSTTLIFNVVVSIIIYGLLFFIAPYIAAFYNRPELIALSRVLFIVIILNSLTVVQVAKMQIALDFRRLAIINFILTLLSGVAGIIAAYEGLGYWSLVIQNLVKNVTSVLLYWIIGKWRPTTGFSMKSFKNLFQYGSNLLLTGILATALDNIQSLVVGKIYKPEQLGYYTRSVQFPNLVSGTLTSILSTVTFPLMSQLQNDEVELMNVFKRIIKITSLFIYPAMIGLAFISKTLILVLLSEKWVMASEYLFWLSISYIFFPLEVINLTLLNAIGRSDLNLKLDLIKTPFIILCMVITLPISLRALVIGRACFAFIYFLIDGIVTYKFFRFGSFKQLFIAWKAIIAACCMAIFLVIFNKLYVNECVLKLILQILLGSIVYVLVLILLRENEVKVIKNKIKNWMEK